MQPGAEPDAAASSPVLVAREPVPMSGVPAALPWRRAALDALSVFVVLRVVLLVLGMVAIALVPTGPLADVPGRDARPVEPGLGSVLAAWERWDALWFLRIAESGYEADDGSPAFFPLYPILVRAVDFVIGDILIAGLLVSNLAAYASLVLLHVLVTLEWGLERARRSLVYLSVFPTAFFLYAPYSESLFLALVLAAFLAARRGAWPYAGIAGALAAATRSLGIVLVAALAVEAWHQARERRTYRPLFTDLPWSAAPAVGFGAYLGWWWYRTGDAFVPLAAQNHWERDPTFPLLTLWLAMKETIKWLGYGNGGYLLLDALISLPALVAAVWVARRMRPSYAVYVWASLLIALTFVWEVRPLMSMPRFLAVLFPIHIGLAAWSEGRRGVHEAMLAVSAALLAVTAFLYLNWYWMF